MSKQDVKVNAARETKWWLAKFSVKRFENGKYKFFRLF